MADNNDYIRDLCNKLMTVEGEEFHALLLELNKAYQALAEQKQAKKRGDRKPASW